MSKLIKDRSGSLIADIFYSNSSGGSGGGAQYLNDLLDVTITSPGSGDVLRFNTSTGMWESAPASSIATPPGGLNGQFQFNDNGILGGSPDLLYDKTARTISAHPVYFSLSNPDNAEFVVHRVFGGNSETLLTPTLSDFVFGRTDAPGSANYTAYLRMVNAGEGLGVNVQNSADMFGQVTIKTSTNTAFNGRALVVRDAVNATRFSITNDGRIYGRELYVSKNSTGDASATYNSSVVVEGDGQNAMAFFNDLGTASDGYKIISMFSRHAPGPGNAGFYSGYYVSGGAIQHTFLFAPGARDFGISVFNGGSGISNPAIYIKDSTNYVGIGTKNPIMPLTVETNSTTISRFSSSAGYANSQLLVPNLMNNGRASFIIGQNVSSSAGTIAYFHSNVSGPTGRALEMFIGIPPITSTKRMVRITDTEIQMTSSDVVFQSGVQTYNALINLRYVHGRRIDGGLPAKLSLSSRLRNTVYGWSDFIIAVNAQNNTNDADPNNDIVFIVDGLKRNIGIHNKWPVATVDIVGTLSASYNGSPSLFNYKEGATYYDTSTRMYMVQLGGINMPEKFKDIFQNLPNFREFHSFVDTDQWPAASLKDFATTTWSVTGAAPLYLSNSPYGWGRSVAFDAVPSGQQISSSQITLKGAPNDFIVGITLHHRPDAANQIRRILKFVNTNGDVFALVYNSGTLVMENLTNATSQNIMTLGYDDRIAIVFLFDRAASTIRISASKRSADSNLIRSLNFTGVNIANIDTISLILGASDGIEAMNMRVHMLFVAEVGASFNYVESFRIVKQLSNKWLV